MLKIGIDLGGTKTEALVLDATGRELCRKRVATPRASYEEILSAIVRLIEDVERECGGRGSIGIGIARPIVFGVILGTGTGGGVVGGGEIVVGPDAIAGEWGHNSLPWPGVDE